MKFELDLLETIAYDVLDEDGALQDIDPDDIKPQWEKAKERRQEQAAKAKNKKVTQFEIEFSNIEIEGREVPADELAEKMNSNNYFPNSKIICGA